MKSALLLVLLWSLVVVHAQTVYLSLNGDNIPNHGYVVISNIGNTSDTALLCNTNYLPDDGGNSGGDWYAPDGTRLGGSFGSTDVPGFGRNRAPGLVRLIRDTATGTPTEGIYSCTVQDDTLTLQTVYVGLYNSGGG